jgi:drug/metabolite transporter (DMT)-like permease
MRHLCSKPERMHQKWTNWLVFALLSIVWGSSFILIKEGLKAFTPYQVASLRMLFAGLVLLPFAIKAFRKIPKDKMGIVIFSGLVGNFFPAYLFCIAETRIDSALAGILNSLTPLFTILVGIIFYKTQTTTIKFLGILIGFVGLTFLLLTGKEMRFENISYASLVLIATIMYGINVHTVGRNLKAIGSIQIASVAFSFLILPSAAVLFFTGFFNYNFKDPIVIHSILSSAVLGMVGTSMASILFYYLVKKAGILFGSMVTYGIPIVAVVWGLIYGESLAPLQVVCLGVILLGVYIVNRGNLNFIPFLKQKSPQS